MSRISTAIPFVFFLSIISSAAFALDVVVDSRGAGYGDYATIAEGLAALEGIGGTVTVNPGLDGIYPEHDLVVPSNVCLRSSVIGTGHVTIDAQGQGRVLYLLSVHDVRVEGFHLVNGNAQGGGGGISVMNAHQGILFYDCLVSTNRAIIGGGAYIQYSNVSFTECEFSGNTAVTVGPSSGHAGGIYAYQGYVFLTLCTVSGNVAATDGGGVYVDSQTLVDMKGSRVLGNHADRDGGGAYLTGGSFGPARIYAGSCEILDNTADGAAPDGLIAQVDGVNKAFLDCTGYDPLQWVVEAGAELNIDLTPNVPCMKTSTASFPFQEESASIWVTPLGAGQGPASVRIFDAGMADGTVTVTLNNSAGVPLDGIPAADVWLESADGGFALRPLPGCGGGDRYASVADTTTGGWGIPGQTTISRPIFGGGSSLYPSEPCRVMTSWGPVGWGDPAHPDGIDLNLFVNSPDINRDFCIDLDDCIEMTRGFWAGTPDYALDLYWDGEIDLMDVIPLIDHGGEYAGEPKTPEPGVSYTVDVVFDVDGRQTRCAEVPDFMPVTGYILLRDYAGEPIDGFEVALEAATELPGLSATYPPEAINFRSIPEFNVALSSPIVPTGGDVVLVEFQFFVFLGASYEIRLVPTTWSSVPGRPVPVIRGPEPDVFYELVPAVGELGDVIASVNTGCPPLADYGDAPDHPGGFFPTRYDTTGSDGTMPGVHHLNIGQEMLGTQVTAEFGADDPFDPDGVPNLINGDAGDDGVKELFLRRIDTISGDQMYWAWAKVQVTIAPEAPDQGRWLTLLFDGNGDGKWVSGVNNEFRTNWLDLEPGTSTTFTTWFGRFPIEAFPPPPAPHNWLRATLSRTMPRLSWAGGGEFQFGETEDYDRVYFNSAPPGFEAYHQPLRLTSAAPKDLVVKLRIPPGSSMEFVGMEIQDQGPLNRPWVYAGADPGVLGAPTPSVGSFIEGSEDFQTITVPVAAMPIPPEYSVQGFGINIALRGYDGPGGTGNLVWSSTVFSGVLIRFVDKSAEGLGELTFGGDDTWPVDTPVPVSAPGGGQPLAYVVFGNDQPTPGTLTVMQIVLDEAPDPNLLPVVTLVDVDWDFDPDTPYDQPLVSTRITGLHLLPYDDAMVAEAGLVEEELKPYRAPLDTDEDFDLFSPASELAYSGYTVDTDADLIQIDDPVGLGAWFFGSRAISGVPQADPAAAGNYPNPFNPRTTITYSLRSAGPLQIKVYTLRGELVATLADGEHPAGQGHVVWNGLDSRGRAAPSGVYVYLIKTEEGQSLGKMTLVR